MEKGGFMGKYIIKGGKSLKGDVLINGSKNAVLPILSATLINEQESVLHNCPDISDVRHTCDILTHLGCHVKVEGRTIIVNSKNISCKNIPKDLVDKMRSSVLFLGVMLGKFGRVIITKPGGCAIGERPVDIHLKAMEALGATITQRDNIIECKAKKLVGTTINLPFPSVGATENIMMAAVYAKGQTVIHNAAREPEIHALQEYLKSIGVEIYGAGTSSICIFGCKEFNSTMFNIIPDRIEAGTYLTAAAMTNGEICVRNVDWLQMGKTLEILSVCGCEIKATTDEIKLKAPKKLKNVQLIKTGVYPYFSTDMQPAIMSMLTICQGTSIIIEQIFENRFKQAEELKKMGASISAQTKVAIIDGVKRLKATQVNATDLRAGAALILAGLNAEGVTTINNSHFIERGYQDMEINLKNLGANIMYSEGEADGKNLQRKGA